MLATQINHLVKDEVLKKFSIIRINDCICNKMGGKKIIIILNLDMEPSHHDQIGDPQNIDPAGGAMQPKINTAPNQGYNVVSNPPQHQAPAPQPQQQPYVKPEPYANRPQGGGAGNQGGYQNHVGGNQGGGYGGNQQGAGGHQQQGFNNTGFQQQNGGGASGYNQGGGGGHQQGGANGSRSGAGILHHDDSSGPVTPIASISPYIGKWCLQARLIVKGTMRHYKNAKGEGRLFNIDLMDATSDIRGTFFNDDADRWMDQLEANKVYKVRGGSIKPANKNFNQTKSEWEITFGRETTFEPCPESAAPKVTYAFKTIEEIESMDTNAVIDVIGVISAADPITEITVKSGANAGNKIPKRDVTLVDQSLKTIRLTLWDANKDLVHEGSAAPVIAIKNVKIGDFQGKNISTSRSSICEINPDMSQAHMLRGWYDCQGRNATFTSMAGGGGGGMKDPRKFMSSIKDENMGHGDKPDYFTVRGWVSFIRSEGTWCYCANPANKKKVIESGDKWLDESTGTTIDQCERRYILSIVASDHTGSTWLSGFNDQGIKIMGNTTADALYEMSMADENQFKATFQLNNFRPYIFKVRAKAESWQDEMRVKCVIQDLTPLDFKDGSRELLELIKAYGVC